MTDPRFRPRSITELVDSMFTLLRRHWAPLATIVALSVVPFAILVFVIVGAGVGFSAAGSDTATIAGTSIALAIAGGLVGLLGWLVVQGALVYAISDAYLRDRIDIGDALRRGLAALLPNVGTVLLSSIVIGIGTMFLLVPGIYAFAALFAAQVIVLLEHRGVFESLGRSSELSRGRKLTILGALLLTLVLVFILRLAISIFALVGGAWVAPILNVIGFVVTYPLMLIMTVLLYYDARIRAEGLDIELATASLPATPA